MLTTDFYFQNFFPKNLAKKLGRVLQPEISGMVCVRACGPAPPRPPFVQMKNTPGGPSRGADFQTRHSARAIDHWVRRSAAGYQFHARVCHILATFDRPLAGIWRDRRR
jgi:hypothetical protein